ncbi:dephospho-CoA kinase [Oscillochloris trichoides DG-6]|uniref:Dephospho-CoA kinase n=1 Tax=Oscillochloris trichoides DG-6 TaxID=765420 RepID=E1IBG0_9CHLR|nr:dephospho-CoA kinase [Oscillochloris trichoides]EFO81517.1 dephospho-CoA kinase [Oscillochloris trichoides DG-6]
MATPYLIGLTGGIACGKSTVVAMLAALGARTIDADRVTHRVQRPGTPVYAQIVATFGPQILSVPNGPIDRRLLGNIVFGNPTALRRLEQIVHPAVRAEIQTFMQEAAESGGYGTRLQPLPRPVVVIDAIKLIESGWADQCQQVWVITCDEAQQIERLISTRGMSQDEARQRIAAQASQGSRLNRATVVIDNSGTQAHTRAQVDAAWQQVVAALM